jgi:hypothetical protein
MILLLISGEICGQWKCIRLNNSKNMANSAKKQAECKKNATPFLNLIKVNPLVYLTQWPNAAK